LDWLAGIDFAQMVLDPTSYVQRDYRRVEADVVLHAPWRLPGKRQRGRRIIVYILIEHQSEPDRHMIFRVHEYVLQIYKAQLRHLGTQAGSTASLRFQPVLPVVFYTGTRRWESLGRMADLVAEGPRFGSLIPELEPLFFNLQA